MAILHQLMPELFDERRLSSGVRVPLSVLPVSKLLHSRDRSSLEAIGQAVNLLQGREAQQAGSEFLEP